MKFSIIGKQKMISALRKIKIRYRLFAVFFFISLVPVLCLGTYAYRVYTASINDKLGDSSLQAVLSLNKNMVTELEKFQDYCSTLSVSAPIQDGLSAVSDGNVSQVRDIVVDISQMTSNQIPFQSKYLKNLRVVDMSGNILYDLGYDDISKERFHEILDGIDQSSPNDSLQYIHTYRAADKLVLGRKLYHSSTMSRPLGYIMIYIDEKLISDKVFSDVSFGEGSNVMLVSSDGLVISSQDRSSLGMSLSPSNLFTEIKDHLENNENLFNTTVNGAKSLVIAVHNASFDNYLVASIPMSYITNETHTINLTLLALAAFLILLSVICTMVVYLSITRPIGNMVAFCHSVPERMPGSYINDVHPDELGFLGCTIDHMVEDLNVLMEQSRQDQVRKRELELQMLQFQINPHFLFNTLNSLQWVAVVNDVPVLAEGISSLSSLLRSTLVKKDELITLGEETDNLTNYFSIQRIRYGNTFDVEYQLDENTLHFKIPRFILQPLAENSILHGSRNDSQPLTITVRSEITERDLIIEITDNGIGFDPLEEKDHKKEHFSGIGTSNVAERLDIYYGTKDCLTIISELGCGTTCRICIPLDRNEVKDDVSHITG